MMLPEATGSKNVRSMRKGIGSVRQRIRMQRGIRSRQPIRIIQLVSCLLIIPTVAFAQVALHYTESKTPEWYEVIAMYESLNKAYPEAKLIEAGITDAGKPLHLFIISADKLFTPDEIHTSGKRIILVNNGIHPGESNGIDASLEFAADLLSGNNDLTESLKNTVVLIVPVFNVGGALNRSPYHRANQNGPEEHGFRANARNLDLNRDFVPMGSRNARSMAKILQAWDPDIFVDTHSTNGADYPYTVTLIPSHPQQLEEPQSSFLEEVMEPALYRAMNESPYKMSPYVNVFRTGPEKGFEGFYLYPRYLAGYTSAFHILSFTLETHMLKPYHERVLSTKYFLGEVLKFTSSHAELIGHNKQQAIETTIAKKKHVLNWNIDTTRYDTISFTGYRAKSEKSLVTGQERYRYDQDDPWTADIPFYNYFTPGRTVTAPKFYIIPFAWEEVIERLKCSNIEMSRMGRDTTLLTEVYTIESYGTMQTPYNGHYRHYNTEVRKSTVETTVYAEDFIIPVAQRGADYIVQTLEPQGYDSFFSWNFFDAILSRKEYFSPYLFEETAMKLLEEDPVLKSDFMKKRAEDPDFAGNSYTQLSWIYERSPWSEPTFRRYPVYRYNGNLSPDSHRSY
jgi:hypothetical protein